MHTGTPHRDAASEKLSGLGKRFFQFIEFDEDEELVLEIRKHPFGLFLVEFTGFFITIFVAGIIAASAFLLDNFLAEEVQNLSGVQTAIIFIALIVALFGIGATFVSALIYKNNVIFVTNEKIAQVLYKNIIDRKISQLSIGDVQDVTVTQDGLFSRLFNYGTLVIETAGEQQNYTFTFVPKPYESAQNIVGAHERNLRNYGN